MGVREPSKIAVPLNYIFVVVYSRLHVYPLVPQASCSLIHGEALILDATTTVACPTVEAACQVDLCRIIRCAEAKEYLILLA
jgi:hypothetical protein